MRIIRLEAENVKKLKVIDITPDETMQIITGANAQGKTSLLDAIWMALGGGKATKDTPAPIRDGEDEAHVFLDLGDLRVARHWRLGKPSTLEIWSSDGAKYPSPQSILDKLVGPLSFDPLAFTRLKPAEQRQTLLNLLGLDFTTDDETRARLYTERTDVGRARNAYGALPDLPADAPLVEISSTPIMERMKIAQQQASVIKDHEMRLADLHRQMDAYQSQDRELADELARIQQKMLDVETKAERMRNILEEEERQPALPQPESLDDLQQELVRVEDTNRQIRANQKLVAARAAQKTLDDQYDRYTDQIRRIDQGKADALAAATMPVDGLGFDDTGVTLAGIPFTQASSAEQIRVSLAVAMALNPDLRVVRIQDGSLLDDQSLAMIRDMAIDNDFQVWVEKVSDTSPSAIIIEDGSVLDGREED